MALTNFAIGLGGLAQGVEAGERIKASRFENQQRQAKLTQEHEATSGRDAYIRTLEANDPTGEAGPSGSVGPAPTLPQTPPYATQGAQGAAPAPYAPQGAQGGAQPLPGATPLPQGAQQAAPPPQPTGLPGAQPLPGAQQPTQGGQSLLGAQPPQGGQQVGQTGGQQGGQQSPFQDYDNWIRKTGRAIRAANPQASPGEIAAGIDYALGQQKQFAGPEREYIQLQLGQLKRQIADTQADEKFRAAGLGAESRERVAQIGAGSRERVAETGSSARRYAAEEGLKGREYGANATVQAAGIRARAEENVAKLRTDAAAGGGGLLGDLKLQKALESTQVGKEYARASTAGAEIARFAAAPDIQRNPIAQLGMINRFLYMTTGSPRPPLSEYHQIMKAATGRDVAYTYGQKLTSAPILGPDQISRLAESAQQEVDVTTERALSDPLTARVLAKTSGRSGGVAGVAATPASKPTPQGAQPASGSDSYPLPPKGKYKSADDAGKAFGNGQISEQQFRGLLKRDFGVQ